MNFKYCFGLASLVYFAVLFGCVNPPEYPIEPYIEFLSLSKDTLPRGISTDSTLAVISFTDGDGDIGLGQNDLFYMDSRDSTQIFGKIPKVPELGASNGIKGEISFVIDNSCCVFPEEFFSTDQCNDEFAGFTYDSIVYSVYIVDRKGHKSNVVKLPAIYIECFN